MNKGMMTLFCVHVITCILAGVLFAKRVLTDAFPENPEIELVDQQSPAIKFSIHQALTFVWVYFLFGLAFFAVSAIIGR